VHTDVSEEHASSTTMTKGSGQNLIISWSGCSVSVKYESKNSTLQKKTVSSKERSVSTHPHTNLRDIKTQNAIVWTIPAAKARDLKPYKMRKTADDYDLRHYRRISLELLGKITKTRDGIANLSACILTSNCSITKQRCCFVFCREHVETKRYLMTKAWK
jgi:hypothetical protein